MTFLGSFPVEKISKIASLLSAVLFLSACDSITQVGEMGPKKLKVYSVTHNGFLSASNMLVILDDRGDLKASAGGVVSGAGTVGLQTASSAVAAGAIVYGAKAIEHGLENASVKGIPSNINVNTTSKFSVDTSS